jgi:hypothetical protein
MAEIKCPHCGEVFKVDENGYSEILKQVHNSEFDRELTERVTKETESAVRFAKLDKDKEIEALRLKLENQEEKNKSEIETLKNAIESEKQLNKMNSDKILSEKETEIESLKSQLKILEESNKTAIDKAVIDKNIEIETLKTTIASTNEINKANLEKSLSEKDAEIEKLKSRLQLQEENSKAETEKQLNEKNIEIAKLKFEAENLENKNKLQLSSKEAEYRAELSKKDELIEYYKDMKIRQSTKMIGESLERHCETEFNKLRATAFKNAYFEKDNDISGGTKGDFIYRENDDDGNEIISIMFEMKNEADETRIKHKNSDFFKKLDKDRKDKKCEYAILVSLLEQDNDFYNVGIADVSYEYDKMYVIRPQFFIQIITILRNAALNSMEYKRELAIERNKNIDITHFEENIETFKNGFAHNYRLYSDHFEKAIADIDKSIKSLEATKEELRKSQNNLRLANNKLEDLSIKKLTKNSPTMAEKFKELKGE